MALKKNVLPDFLPLIISVCPPTTFGDVFLTIQLKIIQDLFVKKIKTTNWMNLIEQIN